MEFSQRPAGVMQKRFVVVVSLAAALLAAVFAHTAIDVLGDYLVRDDAYDHVSHGSRALVTLIALVIGSGVLLHLFSRFCTAARSRRTRTRILGASRKTLAAATTAIVVASLVIVPAMELFDAVRAGSDLDDVGDLFGGSLALGLSTTIATGLLVAAMLIVIVRWICAHEDRIVEALATLIGAEPASIYRHKRTQFIAVDPRRAPGLCRQRKRGPPARLRPVPI